MAGFAGVGFAETGFAGTGGAVDNGGVAGSGRGAVYDVRMVRLTGLRLGASGGARVTALPPLLDVSLLTSSL